MGLVFQLILLFSGLVQIQHFEVLLVDFFAISIPFNLENFVIIRYTYNSVTIWLYGDDNT